MSSISWKVPVFFFLLMMILRALSICQNWPVRPFPSQWWFYFKLKFCSKISQILNFAHVQGGFSFKPPVKSLFRRQTDWSGNDPAGQFWQMESALTCLTYSFLERNLNKEFLTPTAWCQANTLSINYSKSKFMVFKPRHKSFNCFAQLKHTCIHWDLYGGPCMQCTNNNFSA